MERSEDKTVIHAPMHDAEQGNWLSKGYVLQGRYVIEAELGAGGFGVTYLAKHRYLEDLWVAIKEYLPDGAAVRDAGSSVRVISERYNSVYSWGLHRFLDEARLLRQFNHPNIVAVQDFFEANNTAYMVMNHIRGRSLQDELDSGRVFDEQKLRSIIYPLLNALQCIHREGLYHRDISPDNILLREKSDIPVLIDFGSARYAMRMHGAEQTTDRQDHAPTTIFKPGYSPIEQYEGSDQGPYTDIYALGATLYRAALGTRPTDALKRSGELRKKTTDPLQLASEKGHGRFSPKFLSAIDTALKLEVDDRPQTIEAWLSIFGKPPSPETSSVPGDSRRPFWRSPKVAVSVIASVVAAALFALLSVDQLHHTIADVPALLSEAGEQLTEAPFSAEGLDSARNLYLEILTLDQGNAGALSGYSATSTLKQFSSAVAEDDLDQATGFLDKAETELSRAGIDVGVLTPGRQRVQLLNTKAALRRALESHPLSANTWSDITLLLEDISTMQDGESLSKSGISGLEALKATVSAVREKDFDTAWNQIAAAEDQLSPLGISELRTARSQIQTAQRNWQAERDAEIEALLTTAEQALKAQPLTAQQLQQAQQAYEAALELDPEQPRARAGHSVSNSLLKAMSMTGSGEFAAAGEALSDGKRTAANTNLWNGALQEASRQLAAARHARSVSETRSSASKLLAQTAEALITAPFDTATLSQADRLLQEAQALSRKMPELAAETEAASTGSDLVALLNGCRALLDKADFDGARNRMQSKETIRLSRSMGLGRPFLEKARGSISNEEIRWSLARAQTLLSEDLLDSGAQNEARQRLQRVRALDAEHAVGTAALRAILSLQSFAVARQGRDYDTAVAALQAAQPPLIALGVSASLFEAAVASIRDEQEAWMLQQRENAIASKMGEATSILQQHPFEGASWRKSELLFDEVSAIGGGSERADSGRKMLSALKSAQEASDARRFGDAGAQITSAEEMLQNIGAGRLDEARRLVAAASQVWATSKQELIAEALASAERILGGKNLSAAVLQQARQAYQTALDLDKSQSQALAGQAVVVSLGALLQELRADDFDKAEQHLAKAASIAQSARLSPGLLKSAERRLSTDRETWRTNQARQGIRARQQRASELLGSEDPLDKRLKLAEKALQEAAVLGQSHAGLETYATQSSAGLEAIILVRAAAGELDRGEFAAARKTLSDARQRLLEAKIDTAFLDKLSRTVASAEIDWLLADAIRSLSKGLALLISDVGLDNAETNLTAARVLDPERVEIEPALQGIAAMRQLKIARSQRDYDRAMALLEQAETQLSRVGAVEDSFEAIRQRLDKEQRLWKTLALERNLNTWTAEAINALNRSPFDDATWKTTENLVEKIMAARADDHRGLALRGALNQMQQAKQAIDEKRFGDARSFINQAKSKLGMIGVDYPMDNAIRQLDLATSKTLGIQLTIARDALREYPARKAALSDARSALASVLTFLPDYRVANTGVSVIDLIQAADAAIAATEFAKAGRLLTDAHRQLGAIEVTVPPVPQLRKALLDARRRLAGQRPSPSEIFPLISVALEAIADNPLSANMLDTADKLLQTVLAMQSDEPTALAGLEVVERLRIASAALAEGAYSDARVALEQAEKLCVKKMGLNSGVLAPAWRALEAAQK